MAAVPVPDPARPPVALPANGAPPAAGQGCPYRHRCPLAAPRCAAEAPLLRALGDSEVACHLAEE